MDGSEMNPLAAENGDPSSNPKHAAMLERLANNHQARLHGSAARRSSSESSPTFESVDSFLARFADSKRSIADSLTRLRSAASAAAAAESRAEPGAISSAVGGPKAELDAISAEIAELDRLVAENSYYLPSFEVRSSLKTISDLKETLETLTSDLIPRKKFSFKNKSSKKDPKSLVQEPLEATVLEVEKSKFGVRESPGFRNQEGMILVKKFNTSEDGNGEFTLADLNSCEIYLKGRIRALFIHRLKKCRVFVGPVLGSIHIEEVEDCLLMLASHQIRIHEAQKTDFYLRVRSRPIIEDCSGVRFAPYMLFYDGLDEELREAALMEETGNWANVDDFQWLRAVQSPNWRVLPEEEHVGTIDVSGMEEQSENT